MTKHDHEFVGGFEPTTVKLEHRLPDGSEVEIPALKAFNPSTIAGPLRVEFSNADYRVSVRINDELIFRPRPSSTAPTFEDLFARFGHAMRTPFPPPAVSLDACAARGGFLARQPVAQRLLHPRRQRTEIRHAGPRPPSRAQARRILRHGRQFIRQLRRALLVEEVHLPDENLNAESGRVPGRFMLGRAFFVYWPAGYRPLERAPGAGAQFRRYAVDSLTMRAAAPDAGSALADGFCNRNAVR